MTSFDSNGDSDGKNFIDDTKNLIHIDILNRNLEETISSINLISTNSEKDFLEIGNKLRKFSYTSNILTHIATQAADAVSDDILQKGISDLKEFLTEFRSYLKSSLGEIINDKSELQKILPSIEAIYDQISGFDKIVKNLRMLGISTKIESARLGTEDQGFYALAETVDKLSGMIKEKAEVILKKSIFLISELNNSIINLTKLEIDQSRQSDVVINQSQDSINAFHLMYEERVKKTEKISIISSNVSKNIYDIVTSIQIHDITRQRLEHAKSSLDDVSEKIGSILNSGENEELDEKLGFIFDICNLQSIQLKQSIEEFIDAVNAILSDLREVGENFKSIFIEATSLLNENDDSSKSSLKSMKEELVAISNGLKKSIENGNELSKSINSVVSVVDDLSKYVLDIEDLGSEIEIIALNARVKATRTGTIGSALGVLSENIQRLSIDAKSQTIRSSELLDSISNESINLKNSMETGLYKSNNQNMILKANNVNNLINKLIDLEKSAENYINNLKSGVSQLNVEINSTLNGITVSDYTRTLYSKISNALDNIINEISKNGNLKSDRKTNTMELMKKYTMHTERKIHKDFAGDIENNSDPGANNLYDPENNSLDDNIEFF